MVKEVEKTEQLTEQEMIEKRAQEIVKETAEEYRQKAIAWSNEKAKEIAEQLAEEKAIALFEKERTLSNSMKEFQDQQTQLIWMFEQKALPEWDTAWQVMMKKMIGKELGLNTYQSITWLAFIKWKLAIWWKVFVWLITSAGYKIEFIEWDNKKCKCKITSPDWQEMEDTYTLEDAKNAGLYPSNAYSPWTKHTKKMLAYKVINNIASFLCPHIIWWALIADDAKEELTNEKDTTTPTTDEIKKNLTNKFQTNEWKNI